MIHEKSCLTLTSVERRRSFKLSQDFDCVNCGCSQCVTIVHAKDGTELSIFVTRSDRRKLLLYKLCLGATGEGKTLISCEFCGLELAVFRRTRVGDGISFTVRS